MPEKSHPGVYYFDVVVAIFLLVIGVLVSIIGIDYFGLLARAPFPGMIPMSATIGAYVILLIGITTILYGIKRMIDDIIKARSSE